MKTLLGSVVFLLFSGGAFAADKDYTSEDGKYAVSFLAKARYRSGSIKESGITSPFIEAKVKDNYQKVMHFDLPEAARDVATDKLFDGGVDGEVNKTKGKLLSSKDLKWGPDKLPARDFVLEIGKHTTRYRIIRNDLRFYILIAGGPDEYGTGDEAKAFFDSFELTK